MLYNLDLHIHGLFSGAVSKNMKPEIIAEQARLKGLHGVGTGDILHPKWREMFIEETVKKRDGFEKDGIFFFLQTEVEDMYRVHHVLLFPSLSQVEDFSKEIKSKTNLEADGRPKIHMTPEEIKEIAHNIGCLIGPAHAFTPYTGYYSRFNSLKEGYGKNDIDFLELGLSADTEMADQIKELQEVIFLSNSDAHSPWPNKLGREFNVIEMEELSFESLRNALKKRKIEKNIGLDPREGKYHKTRCRKCFTFYDPEEAKKLGWRCKKCGGIIKKGVDYRIKELSSVEKGIHPKWRAKYIHIIPLSEIISLALNTNYYAKKVQELWKKLVERYGNEINILLNIEIEEIKKINKEVGKIISLFRKGKIKYIPGGAGKYGEIYIEKQSSLSNF